MLYTDPKQTARCTRCCAPRPTRTVSTDTWDPTVNRPHVPARQSRGAPLTGKNSPPTRSPATGPVPPSSTRRRACSGEGCEARGPPAEAHRRPWRTVATATLEKRPIGPHLQTIRVARGSAAWRMRRRCSWHEKSVSGAVATTERGGRRCGGAGAEPLPLLLLRRVRGERERAESEMSEWKGAGALPFLKWGHASAGRRRRMVATRRRSPGAVGHGAPQCQQPVGRWAADGACPPYFEIKIFHLFAL